jgi:hypothetical protein
MLPAHQREPFASGDFFINSEARASAALGDFLYLVLEDTGKNGNAMRFEHAMKLGKQIDDQIRRQIADE